MAIKRTVTTVGQHSTLTIGVDFDLRIARVVAYTLTETQNDRSSSSKDRVETNKRTIGSTDCFTFPANAVREAGIPRDQFSS